MVQETCELVRLLYNKNSNMDNQTTKLENENKNLLKQISILENRLMRIDENRGNLIKMFKERVVTHKKTIENYEKKILEQNNIIEQQQKMIEKLEDKNLPTMKLQTKWNHPALKPAKKKHLKNVTPFRWTDIQTSVAKDKKNLEKKRKQLYNSDEDVITLSGE